MDILNIKVKKEQVKILAKKSILFSASSEGLKDFISVVDSIEENEQAEGYLDEMIHKFELEKEAVINGYKGML